MQEQLENLIFMIRVAQELGRPYDMIPLCKQFVMLTPHLNFEERILYSQAYHEAVSSLRQSLQIVQSFVNENNSRAKECALSNCIDKMRTELTELCGEVIQTVDTILLPVSETPVDYIFYNKMKGDYWRYSAEFQTGSFKDHAVGQASMCYETALRLAEEHLGIVNPMRLGLILNYTVFLVDCKGEKETACDLSRATLNEVQKRLTVEIPEESDAQDIDICLKLISDNCELWMQENE